MKIENPELLTHIEKIANYFYDRGFVEPFIGVWVEPVEDVQTPYGIVKFIVDKTLSLATLLENGSLSGTMYIVPHEVYEQEK